IALDPRSALAHANLGAALGAKGRLAEAVAACQKAIALAPDGARSHINLGSALLEQGEFTRALPLLKRGHELGLRSKEWRYPSAQVVEKCERLLELDDKLPAILTGKQEPASAAERLEYAQVCAYKRLHAASARFYEQLFAAQPALADALVAGHRFRAACAAALVGTGQARDGAAIGEAERARWWQQALDWLHADL